MLNEIEQIPAGLLTARADELVNILSGPTLLHLQGARSQPLFISVLQHGNEYSGWESVRRFLTRYQSRELPRSVSIFIGNIRAAGQGLRHLPEQPDYNRVWNGGDLPEHGMMQAVLASMARRNPFASIDLHNNTGKNPHYACLNRIDNRFIHLARMFSETIVYFIRPDGVQSKAFAELCPAVTLECGKPGEEDGIEHAMNYLERCIQLEEIPAAPVDRSSIDLYHTLAIVKVRDHINIGFENEKADIVFSHGIEEMNLKEIPAGRVIAKIEDGYDFPLSVTDESGRDIYSRYFQVEDGNIINKKSIIPSMFTLDKRIIFDDCLCYLMEHYAIE